MVINMRIIKAISAVLSAAVIVVSGILIFNATRPVISPQSFNGELTIVSLSPDTSKPWPKACIVTLRDEKKRELTTNTRSDVCQNSHPGDKLKVDAGTIILDQKQGY